MKSYKLILTVWMDPEGGHRGPDTPPPHPPPPQVAISNFLRNSGTDHPREAIGPIGGPNASQGGRYSRL